MEYMGDPYEEKQMGEKSMKNCLKITLAAAPDLFDSIADFAVGVMDGAVEMEVGNEHSSGVMHLYFEKDNPSSLDIEKTVQQLRNYVDEIAVIFKTHKAEITWQVIVEEDWERKWKEYFTPFFITPLTVIAPTWEDYVPKGKENVIVMDPGMAFGTGHHATTALALEMVEKEVAKMPENCSVLDVGTGTGVLGIAAALVGVEAVYAIDNDAVAVEVAAENARLNDVDEVMRVSGEVVAKVSGSYQLVIANIIHDVLVEIAPDLSRLTAIKGRLILSGVLAGEQVSSIINLFSGCGFSLLEEKKKDEWAALLFEKDDPAE